MVAPTRWLLSGASASASRRLLEGVTVVSFEQAVAAPYTTAKLADDGARVIKVERQGHGDFARHYDNYARGSSTYFSWLNRGKESLEIDIKEEASRKLLMDLIHDSDVVVQNLAPGAMKRAGFGSEELRKLYPKLITLDISGYGMSGPLSTYKAYDLLVAAEAGLCEVTGTKQGPGRVGVSICDITAGANGYAAILRGLLERHRTGLGQGFSVSLFDSVAEIMNVPLLQQKYTGSPPKRWGLEHPSIVPYGAFRTRDNRIVLISIQNEREWVLLCDKVLGKPELHQDARFESPTKRVEHRETLNGIIADEFSKHSATELKDLLLKSNIAFGELNDVKGLVQHPLLRTVQYANEFGETVELAAPAIISSKDTEQANSLGNVPKLGSHNEKIRNEYGH